jgi:hypothetical protein
MPNDPTGGGEHAADRMTPEEYQEWSADATEDDETPEHAEFRQFRSEAFRESLTTDSLAQSLETRVLSDAAAYREDPGECAGCTEGHGLIEPCPDHAADLDQAAAYRAVAFRLGDDR